MNAREASFKILEDIWYKDGYSNLVIKDHINKYKLEEDSTFIRSLVYGVLENQIYIDYIISKMSNIKMGKIHKHVLTALRLGIYQILFMDLPDRAAVNESVELIKKYGNKGSVGFVNGILRNISRKKDEVVEIDEKDRAKRLSIKYSHPEWMVFYFIDEFGIEFTKSLLEKNNQVAEFYIRVNRLKTNKNELKKKLEDKGYLIEEIEGYEEGLKVLIPTRMTSLREFKNGEFTIQDKSSMTVAKVLNPKPGSKVLDVAAAPGGKTTHIGELMENTGEIYARDIHRHRSELIEKNAKRLAVDIIHTQILDGTILDESMIDNIDYCLLDVPCTGLGTIRRNPEIKYNRSITDLKNMAKLQLEILNTSKNYIKKGGYILYSTCTIGSIENDKVIEKFLEENENFELVDLREEGFDTEEKVIKMYPNTDESDGFYIAKMVRCQ